MSRRLPAIGALAGMLLCAAPLRAHHSFGVQYDEKKPITLSGVVSKVEWTNPHSHVYLDVADDTGKVVTWKFEGYNPAVLSRIGWKRDMMLKPGDRITLFGWQARDGGPWGHSREITLPGGQKLFFGPPAGTGEGGNTPAVEVK
jgi:hypothetical protein